MWKNTSFVNHTSESANHSSLATNVTETPEPRDDVTTLDQVPPVQSTLLVAVDVINRYMFPASLGIGVVLNVLVVLLMRRPAIRKTNFSIYITALALSDTSNLMCYIFVMYPFLVFQVDFRTLSDAGCRVFRYLVKTSICYSSWMVCIIALERVFVVSAPFLSKKYIKKKNALLITIGLFVTFLIGMNPYLWMSTLIDGLHCVAAPKYADFDLTYGRWIEAAMYQYIPGVVVVVCNLILLTKLLIIRKKRAAMTNNTNKEKQDNFVVTAVTICFAYLAFAMPNSIFYVLYVQGKWYINATPSVLLLQASLNVLGIFNYSSNLILYILSSRTMRKAFFEMISCCRRGEDKKSWPVLRPREQPLSRIDATVTTEGSCNVDKEKEQTT